MHMLVVGCAELSGLAGCLTEATIPAAQWNLESIEVTGSGCREGPDRLTFFLMRLGWQLWVLAAGKRASSTCCPDIRHLHNKPDV